MGYYRGSDQAPAHQPPGQPATMINPPAAPATKTRPQSALARERSNRSGHHGRARVRTATLIAACVLGLGGETAAAQQPPYRPGPPAATRPQSSRSAPTGPRELDITQGTLKPIPIAVPELMGEEAPLGRERADPVSAAL